MKNPKNMTRGAALMGAALLSTAAVHAQAAAPAETQAPAPEQEETIKLSPFEVTSTSAATYYTTESLAGNRLKTDLRDIGSAVSVFTEQFLKDIGATNNETLLQYTTGTEVGNIYGNYTGVGNGTTVDESGKFTSPNTNTRVRGLAAADNTRDFFLTDIPWDGYNIDRVDMQRGPNAILFGMGSPAGIINNGTKGASFRNSNEAEVRFGSFGSTRASLNLNRVLSANELAIRLTAVDDQEKFKQEPAFERDRRLYTAVRYEPKFLSKGSAHTTIKANFEVGDIKSNRPRTLSPIDYISDWFKTGTYTGYASNGTPITYNNLNRQTFDPFFLQDDVTQLPDRGQARPSYNVGGARNPYYQPLLGNFAQVYGGPIAVFDGSNSAVQNYFVPEIRTIGGLSSTGAVDGSIGGFPYHRFAGLNQYYQYAKAANLPFSKFGVYKNVHMTDASIFDFYNNLIDGPNKKEWQDFRVTNVSLSQTFWDNKVGFEAVYDNQHYHNGQLSLLSDQKQAVYIDMMGTLADGSPNPNVGRPFISDGIMYGNNDYVSDRESMRVTMFATHDFNKGRNNWITKLLGKHTITGLFSTDEQETDRRNFQRYGTDAAFKSFMVGTATTKFTDNLLQINPVIYLGPTLKNRTTASGANIPAPSAVITPSNGQVWAFDSTWKASGVNPGDAWENTFYPVGNGQRTSTQSENPANYAGWRKVGFNLVDSENGHRDELTWQAQLSKSRVSSKAFVWQGSLWDNAIVPMFGYRKDRAKAWSYQPAQNSVGQAILDNYMLPSDPKSIIEDQSRSWSVVAHLSQFLPKKFPLRVSVFYNQSENFQPAAGRVDIYGAALPAPKGKTVDKGIMISTKDDKYSLKINKYETSVKDATSSSIANSWFLGALQAWGGNWCNIFEHNLTGYTMDTAQPTGTSGRYTYGQATGETAEQAAARETAAVNAWRQHQKNVPAKFYKAWGIDIDQVKNLSSTGPAGMALTEDAVSKGYEIEFSAQPTSSLRLTVNASKTEAIRTNIGGAAFLEYVGIVERDLKNTAAGDLRIWWGGAGNTTTLLEWNNNVGSDYAAKRLTEGTAAPELREWRVNFIANYDFKKGFLKGTNAGIGWRWQDDVVIGYKPTQGATANDVSFDLTNPYRGPAESNIDFWVGYGRKLANKIDWRIQLNVRNAFEGNKLIPISTQPDGSVAAWRIAPVQTWTISNTFKF